MKILFLDESGDHNLVVLDKNYPVFVLGGCVLDDNTHNVLTDDIKIFKQNLFGTEEIILHYKDYTRNKNGYEKMQERIFREEFYERLNSIILNTNFTLISCVVDKEIHKNKYGLLAIDPYILSLEVIVERFVMLLREMKEKGVIIAESRGNQLDNELNLAFLNIKIKGTRFLRPKEIIDTIDNFIVKKKEENIAGLQLVDTLVTPIGRRYINKKNYYINYATIKNKFRKIQCGKYIGYGLVILPKK